jgi:hypothetical protein
LQCKSDYSDYHQQVAGMNRMLTDLCTASLQHYLLQSNTLLRYRTDEDYQALCHQMVSDQVWLGVAARLKFGYYKGDANGKLQRVLPKN